MKRITTLLICILLLFYSCTKKVEDPCSEPYPCPPPTIIYPMVNFQLLDSTGSIIDLKPSDIDSIVLSSEWHTNDMVNIDTTSELINVEFLTLVPDFPSRYTLQTPFGETQTIDVINEGEWTDECQWCKNYYIISFVQNETDTIPFIGIYNDEIIKIKIQ